MRVFVEDDLANGISPRKQMVCDACHDLRPLPGAMQYDRYLVCNECAIDYEVARVRGTALTIGQFVRDRTFGDGEVSYEYLPYVSDGNARHL